MTEIDGVVESDTDDEEGEGRGVRDCEESRLLERETGNEGDAEGDEEGE